MQAKSGHGQIVAAMAEPGVGKSRLFHEFRAVSQSGWMVLETFSVSHGKASAYLPVIDLLHTYFRIAGEDDQRVRREKVAAKLSILDPLLEDARLYLFSLLGIVEGDDPLAEMDGQVRKRRTLDAIKRILLRESLNQPLMVIFEDLHWIDEQTQELLNLLADSIATARLILLVNYRPGYSHQWGSKTYYTQLRLDPLGKESAEEMLEALLGNGKDLVPLKRMIIERTEGTPFFMEEIVQSLFDDGVLQRNGVVKLAKSMNAVKVPATVQGVLAARIDLLPAEEKELLQTLGVIGREFPLGLVRSVTQKSDDDLNRMLSELQLAEFIYEQPAVGDTEYIFKHALTQEVAYNSLLVERRKLLHERAGQALESIFAGQLEDHLDELAHQYSRSDNIEKAVEYLGRAGNQAMQRSAYNDAINGLTAAIDRLQKLPDTAERTRRELLLQLAVGPASITNKGWAAPEVERTYLRARDLCEQLGDPAEEFFPSLYGLWLERLVRGELTRACELAEEFLRRAESAGDRAIQMYGRYVLGNTLLWMGDSVTAREHLEIAIALYDPERHRTLAQHFEGVDANVNNLTLTAMALWQLGYPDQALQRTIEAFALAQQLSHPRSLARVSWFTGLFHQFRRDVRAAQDFADSVLVLSAKHGITEWSPWATSVRGWTAAAQGRHEEGIAQLRHGMAISRATGLELLRPHFLRMLAEANLAAGRLNDAQDALTEALAIADQHQELSTEPEIYRLRGEPILRQEDSNIAEAKRCFERAIEIARKQSAKSWELRASTSLARLLDKQGQRDQARAMLADIYNWFTEGFDTADLKDINTLLEELKG
jgi:predicted ATPase